MVLGSGRGGGMSEPMTAKQINFNQIGEAHSSIGALADGVSLVAELMLAIVEAKWLLENRGADNEEWHVRYEKWKREVG